MIPLRDNQPTSTFPVVTVILIAINVVVFLASYESYYISGAQLPVYAGAAVA